VEGLEADITTLRSLDLLWLLSVILYQSPILLLFDS
jgi:hypothetical protein